MRTIIPLLILAISSLTLSAQEPTGPTDAQTPAPVAADTAPILRTARLTWFHGDLQIQRTDNTAATPTANNSNPDSAVLNMPISEGSRLVTGDNAEADIEFEDGSVARLTPKTALSVDSLTVTGKVAATQLSLLGGLAYFELRHAPTATYTIAAGNILAAPADNAVFRIALDQPPALVSVLGGTLTVSADTPPAGASDDAPPASFTATVKAGESLHADPDDPTRYFLNPQLAENSWDTWNQARDTAATTEAATRTTARDDYAGTQGYGWSDLDANGTWYTVTNPDGTTSQLWQPAIAADAAADSSPDSAASADAGDYADAFDPYGGAGGINIGRHPRRYNVIHFPPISPVHPILRVHTSAPHTPAPHNPNPVPVKIAGAIATPQLPLPASSIPASGFVGGSLSRDYPVAETHKPILGTTAPAVTEGTIVTGWIARPPAPDAPRIVRMPSGGNYVRPAVPARVPAPAPAPKSAPAPAAAPGKPK